jgi:protein-disulfide isomerase
MKLTSLLTISTLASAIISPVVMAEGAIKQDTNVSAEQKKQFEQVIHDYLVSSPEVLLEASKALQTKQQDSMQKAAKSAIIEHSEKLLNEKLAVAGNPKGDVTVVEFFDYQCGHCKQMKPVLVDLLNKNKNVRIVYKEFPIFGKTSEFAAKASLAAGLQGKYLGLHDVLLQSEKPLDNNAVLAAAKELGLNITQLQKDMESKAIVDELADNRKLAEEMHLMGTPAFVVLATPAGVIKAGSEPEFVPGGLSYQALQALVDKAV